MRIWGQYFWDGRSPGSLPYNFSRQGLIVPAMSRHRAVRNLDLDGIDRLVSVETDVSADYLDDAVDDDSYEDEVQGSPLG
jgi:hypothetical protein